MTKGQHEETDALRKRIYGRTLSAKSLQSLNYNPMTPNHRRYHCINTPVARWVVIETSYNSI